VDAYLANLELAKRPHRTIQSKRRFLLDFLGTIPKKFVHEFGRNDMLTFRNKQMSLGHPHFGFPDSIVSISLRAHNKVAANKIACLRSLVIEVSWVGVQRRELQSTSFPAIPKTSC
jgi:hypothetical protein